jgi:2'-5' RNA ligase
VPLLSADPSAFPAEPPADLDDLAGITALDWAAFDALAEMTDHWSRPGWADGARAYYWMLTFSDAPALLDIARRCQEPLAPLGLDLVPGDGLHITLARVGRHDALTPGQLQAVARTAAQVLPCDFSLRAVPLSGSRGAVRFSVGPWGPLVRLHAALLRAAQIEGISPSKPTAHFRPHLSIAYNNRNRDARPVAETVASLRSLPAVDVEVTDVQLVELRREGFAYRWEVLESLPLTAGEFVGPVRR